MKSIFPLILIVLLLTGAISYALSKRAIPKEAETRFGIAANDLKDNTIDIVTPTPTPTTIQKTNDNSTVQRDTVTPSLILPTAGQKGGVEAEVVTPKVIKTTKTVKTVVCTPVYGQANTCTEHIVVDTGAQDAIFFNFAGLSYLAGLAAFVKAKTLKA